MTNEPSPDGAAPVHADIRALYLQGLRESVQHKAEALRLQTQVLAAADQIAALKADAARTEEAHAATLADRDKAHADHIARHEADCARLHQTVREQAQEILALKAQLHALPVPAPTTTITTAPEGAQ